LTHDGEKLARSATLGIKRGRVYIDGKLNDPWPIEQDPNCGIRNLPVPVRVLPGNYYVVGDNRGESAYSREWGPVATDWIIGKVVN
jgi:signal peptidase I